MRRLALLALLFSVHSFAVVQWWDFTPKLTYSDETFGCFNEEFFPAPLYLVLEVVDGKVVRGKWSQLKNGSDLIDTAKLMLTPEEIAQIGFYKGIDRIWFTQLPLTERIMKWLMDNSDNYFKCKPPAAVASLVLPANKFIFDLKAVHAGLSWSDSQKVRFGGRLEDGREFSATFRLSQGLY